MPGTALACNLFALLAAQFLSALGHGLESRRPMVATQERHGNGDDRREPGGEGEKRNHDLRIGDD